MHILPRDFQELTVKLRTKLSDTLEEKHLQMFPKIRDLSTGIWQSLKVHTAFVSSTADYLRRVSTQSGMERKKERLEISAKYSMKFHDAVKYFIFLGAKVCNPPGPDVGGGHMSRGFRRRQISHLF